MSMAAAESTPNAQLPTPNGSRPNNGVRIHRISWLGGLSSGCTKGFSLGVGSWRLGVDSFSQRLRRLRRRPDHPRELAALHQLPSLAAAAGDVVLGGADRLLGTAAGLDGHQIAIPGRGDEAQHAVLWRRQLDQDHAAAWARQETDVPDLAKHGVRFPRGGNDDLATLDARHADELRL